MKREGAWQKKRERKRGDRVQRCRGSPPHCHTVLYSSRLPLPLVPPLLLPPAFPDLSLSDEAGAGRGGKREPHSLSRKSHFLPFRPTEEGRRRGERWRPRSRLRTESPTLDPFPGPALPGWPVSTGINVQSAISPLSPLSWTPITSPDSIPPNPSSGFALLSAGWILYRAGG